MGEARGLELGRLLGQGGMGVVHEAVQVHLRRTVAVKRIRPDRTGDAPVRSLLAEGRVTGAVAHPAVVPVHDLVLGEDGRPELVLKRIQGRPWSRLLRDASAVIHHVGREDVLTFHIEVLEQVASAVHAAHRRGILHRDLKPGNVMVGRHAEVYLLDWGLGVTQEVDADPRLPRARPGGSAGTPQYMAPEMVSSRFGQLGPWSDVYLLGGLLHVILFGTPPHHGANVWNVVVEACHHGVTVPDEGPPELVALCRRCLSRKPSDRIGDAETVRRALRTWLDHRPSDRLAAEARLQLGLLQELIRARGAGEVGVEVEARIHQAFGAAVFASGRALALWPGNADARATHEAAVEAAVDHALENDAPALAEAALATLSSPPPDLARRVRMGLRRFQVSPALWAVLSAAGAVLLAEPLLPLLPPFTGVSLRVGLFVAHGVGLVAIGATVAAAAAHGLSRPGARVAAFLVLTGLSRLLVDALAYRAALPDPALPPLHGILTATLALVAALAFGRDLRIATAVLVLCSLIALVFPVAAAPALFLGHAVLVGQVVDRVWAAHPRPAAS